VLPRLLLRRKAAESYYEDLMTDGGIPGARTGRSLITGSKDATLSGGRGVRGEAAAGYTVP